MQPGLTIAGFVEAVLRVAVGCENGHLVPAVLQPYGSINNQALGPADAQVGMEEDYVLFGAGHVVSGDGFDLMTSGGASRSAFPALVIRYLVEAALSESKHRP